MLRGLARHAGGVPIAETDLLAARLGAKAGLMLPDAGPLTVAIADAALSGGRIRGTAVGVPWTRASDAIVLVATTSDILYVGLVHIADVRIEDGHNLAGEPRDRISFDLPAERLHAVDTSAHEELLRRGAWARRVQIIGALDKAAELSVAHTRKRVQFGRPLRKFQSVQHALATMAGGVERARAATALAVAAASDYGFAAAQTNYAVTVAKVVLGRVISPVTAIAHQLHGAIGVTAELRLGLSTMPSNSAASPSPQKTRGTW